MKLQYLWHSFFKISFAGVNILVDPFVSVPPEGTFQLNMKCPVNVKKLKNIGLIFISNEHFDHFDKEVVEIIANRDHASVIGHESILNDLNIPPSLKNNVKVGDKLSLRGVDIEVRSAHYPNSFYPLSFCFTKDKEKIFFAGNTALTDSFNDIDCDVAIVPIGGSSTMDVIDAVRATKTMKPKYAIPMHYNSFDSIIADPEEFKSRIDKSILKTIPIILKPGQSFKTP
ncbi:MAG: MBL fold metallo-hydrolase [Candidatus Diapherotrites archaeon]